MNFEELVYEVQDYVGIIRLNRPEARNALTFKTLIELRHGLQSGLTRLFIGVRSFLFP